MNRWSHGLQTIVVISESAHRQCIECSKHVKLYHLDIKHKMPLLPKLTRVIHKKIDHISYVEYNWSSLRVLIFFWLWFFIEYRQAHYMLRFVLRPCTDSHSYTKPLSTFAPLNNRLSKMSHKTGLAVFLLVQRAKMVYISNAADFKKFWEHFWSFTAVLYNNKMKMGTVAQSKNGKKKKRKKEKKRKSKNREWRTVNTPPPFPNLPLDTTLNFL